MEPETTRNLETLTPICPFSLYTFQGATMMIKGLLRSIAM